MELHLPFLDGEIIPMSFKNKKLLNILKKHQKKIQLSKPNNNNCTVLSVNTVQDKKPVEEMITKEIKDLVSKTQYQKKKKHCVQKTTKPI